MLTWLSLSCKKHKNKLSGENNQLFCAVLSCPSFSTFPFQFGLYPLRIVLKTSYKMFIINQMHTGKRVHQRYYQQGEGGTMNLVPISRVTTSGYESEKNYTKVGTTFNSRQHLPMLTESTTTHIQGGSNRTKKEKQ